MINFFLKTISISVLVILIYGCKKDNEEVVIEPYIYEEKYYGEGFSTLNNDEWNKNTVNKVLNTFTYGIVAKQSQIQTWADMNATDAIKEIITMEGFNDKLNKYNTSFLDKNETRIEILSEIFYNRYNGGNFRLECRLSNGEIITPLLLDNTNFNPTRLKIGLWETNYHQVINAKIDALHCLNIHHYFDDIVEGINDNVDYHKILSKSAHSTPIMFMYNQFDNKYINGTFLLNDDFAREYNQLFFGILGVDNLSYYENTTIENTAKILTGIDKARRDYTTLDGLETVNAPDYYVLENPLEHYSGTLEILENNIQQSSVEEGLNKIGEIAIRDKEGSDNLPIIIIEGLSDDNLDYETKEKIRNEWKNNLSHPNFLQFIQKYAISHSFHNENRLKYLSSLDRVMKTYNLLNFEGKKPINIHKINYELLKEDYKIFFPAKGVFGNLTGEDILNNSNVFSVFYNRAANIEYSNTYTDMDFSKMIDDNVEKNIKSISEFVWNRFIGDNLKNFGKMERLHIYSILAHGVDYNEYKNTNIIYTEEYINNDQNILNDIEDMSKLTINLIDTTNKTRIKYITHFVLGLPFMWFEEGK